MVRRKDLFAASFAGVASLVILAAVTAGSAQEAQITGPTVPVDVDTAGLKGPVQPVFYRHDIHVTQYELDCRYCHFAAEISPSPGLPTMSTCMGCHLLAGAANPEVQKMKATINRMGRKAFTAVLAGVMAFTMLATNGYANSAVYQQTLKSTAWVVAKVEGGLSRGSGAPILIHFSKSAITAAGSLPSGGISRSS